MQAAMRMGSGERARSPRTLFVLAVVFLCFSAIALNASEAQATASATASWGGIYVVKGVPVPEGRYVTTVYGSGTYVAGVVGQPKILAPWVSLANWQITAEFFDLNGRWYATWKSPVQWGTMGFPGGRVTSINIGRWVRQGRMYSTLYSSGGRLCSNWFDIR